MWLQAMTEEKKPDVSQYNIDGKALEAFLGPLEANVMDAIWSSKKTPTTVREIYEALKKTKISPTQPSCPLWIDFSRNICLTAK